MLRRSLILLTRACATQAAFLNGMLAGGVARRAALNGGGLAHVKRHASTMPLAAHVQRAPPPIAFDIGHSGAVHLASRVPRSPSPWAFDGGNSVSLDQIRSLLSELEADKVKGLLNELTPEQLKALLSGAEPERGLDPSESDRVGVFERVSPSVAYIQTTLVQRTNPFSQRANEYPMGAGSGFVWDTDGHICTNFHVVNGGPVGAGRGGSLPRKVLVKLPGCAEQLEATVVGTEPDKDLAVLKVDPSKVEHLRPLDIGNSASLKVGQNVLAIGNPFGLDWTLTKGIVSALGRDIDGAGGRPIKDCVQTDAAINPGNSGGPLLDSRGRLVGINTMIYAPGGIGANVGIGFAVPADTVKRVVNQIIQYGSNARPSIGVSVLPDAVRKQYSRSLGRELEGAIVAEVVPGGPAQGLGLAPMQRQFGGIMLGDMIVAVNGRSVQKNEDLLCAVEEAEQDAPITLTVMRNCEPSRVEELKITPVQRKALSGQWQ